MKKPIEKIKVGGAVVGEDFEIVSKLVMMDDYFTFKVYEECMSGDHAIANVMKTHFEKDWVEYVYRIPGEEINIKLAATIGMGVIKDLEENLLLYNADTSSNECWEEDEQIKLGMYYQLTFPDYHDPKLEIYLRENMEQMQLLSPVENSKVISKLERIFAAQKGGDNIVEFRKEQGES